MTPTRKATILFSVSMLIVFFWVIPGINHGKETRYVRYYEDTDKTAINRLASQRDGHLNQADTTRRQARKLRKEIIEPRKSRRVDGKMFSRAMQYEPIIQEQDSLLELAENDSLAVMQ
jgi:hypothetical protein